jgi:hypothetical protein
VVICPHLAQVVREIEPGVPAVLIENAPGSGDAPVAGSGHRIRRELGLTEDAPIVLYTGTFEAYQGLDLLLAAARQVLDRELTEIGSGADGRSRWRWREQAARAGIADAVIFAGQRPADEILFLDAADVLVSPRSTGTNTLSEDLSIPAIRPANRSDSSLHTGVNDGRSDDRDPDGFASGSGGAHRSGPRACAVTTGPCRYQMQLQAPRAQGGMRCLTTKSTPQVAGGIA